MAGCALSGRRLAARSCGGDRPRRQRRPDENARSAFVGRRPGHARSRGLVHPEFRHRRDHLARRGWPPSWSWCIGRCSSTRSWRSRAAGSGAPSTLAVVVLAYATALIDASKGEAGAIVWAVAILAAFIVIVRARTGPRGPRGCASCRRWRCSASSSAAPEPCCSSPATSRRRGDRRCVWGRTRGRRLPSALQRLRVSGSAGARHRRGRRAHPGPGGLCSRAAGVTALRDPRVEVAFAIDDGGPTTWVDEFGHRIEPLRASGSRTSSLSASTDVPSRSSPASRRSSRSQA